MKTTPQVLHVHRMDTIREREKQKVLMVDLDAKWNLTEVITNHQHTHTHTKDITLVEAEC